MFKFLRNEKGFTMIEMMVVLIIIGVLIAGGVRFYLGYIEGARITKAKGNINIMQAAMDSYYAQNYDYPVTTSELLDAGIIASGENPFTLDTRDPWGNNYKIDVIATSYSAYTGTSTVEGQSGTYVCGTGMYGTSAPPITTTSNSKP